LNGGNRAKGGRGGRKMRSEKGGNRGEEGPHNRQEKGRGGEGEARDRGSEDIDGEKSNHRKSAGEVHPDTRYTRLVINPRTAYLS